MHFFTVCPLISHQEQYSGLGEFLGFSSLLGFGGLGDSGLAISAFNLLFSSQGFQRPISDGGGQFTRVQEGTALRWEGTLRVSRRANRKIF